MHAYIGIVLHHGINELPGLMGFTSAGAAQDHDMSVHRGLAVPDHRLDPVLRVFEVGVMADGYTHVKSVNRVIGSSSSAVIGK